MRNLNMGTLRLFRALAVAVVAAVAKHSQRDEMRAAARPLDRMQGSPSLSVQANPIASRNRDLQLS